MQGARQLAKRVDDGLRRDNEVLWRYVFNFGAQRHFRRTPPALGEAAQGALADLHRDGVARTTLADLTGDDALLGSLQECAYEAEKGHTAARADQRATAARPFLIMLLDPRRPEVRPDGPLAATATHPQLKGVVDSYLGLTSRVSDLNLWRNPVMPGDAPAATQLWHRDLAEDRRLVKIFVYLEAVGPGGGPFSYVRRSHMQADAARRERDGMAFDGVNYRVVDADEVARLEREAEVCTGPAGAVVFADTRGLHYGGRTRDSSRFLMQVRYTSATASRSRMLAAPAGVDPRPWRRHLSYDRRASRSDRPPSGPLVGR